MQDAGRGGILRVSQQVTETVYRYICIQSGVELHGSQWVTLSKVTENHQAKILWDLRSVAPKNPRNNTGDISAEE